VAARGSGVLETFVAIVQDMLTAIALKYNLKEKGLDPAGVPDIVAQAFAALVSRQPPPLAVDREDPRRSTRPGLPDASPPRAPIAPRPPSPVSPARVIISQLPGGEPAGAGRADGSPISDELLHRSIRSNVELAEALAGVVREVHLGLGTILSRAEALVAAGEGAPPDRVAGVAGDIQREAVRLRRVLQGVGQAARAGAPPRVAPSAVPSSTPVGARAAVPAPGRPAAASAAAHSGAPSGGSAASTLDGLLAEVVEVVREPLHARQLSLTSRLPRGTALPRCSPAGLRRALAALLRGLAAVVAPGSALTTRAERKPVLLRGRDGKELRRDFLMLAFTHSAGLGDEDQQRVLNGTDAGPLGEAYRLIREMGGFMRFAPLPQAALETRAFLPM